jgi:hypothetical protein
MSDPIDLTADNDHELCELVMNALKAVGVNELGLSEFESEHLLMLHRGGYKSLMMFENATKAGLTSCRLPSALCDFLWSYLVRHKKRGGGASSKKPENEAESSSSKKPRLDSRDSRSTQPTAKVISDGAASSSDAPTNIVEDPSDKVKQKIRKLLETATNEGATESERQNAMFLAKKLMGSIGVTESDIQSSNATNLENLVRGKTLVKIHDTKIWASWFNNLTHFACTLCTVGAAYVSSRMELTFYGVKDRTLMAANAFEIMFNRLPSIVNARPSSIHGTAEINSYRIGIIAGLTNRVKVVTQNQVNDNEIRAIVVLDDAAKKVADDMKLSMKLTKPRKSAHKFSRSAYNHGLEDSKKIAIHQDRLE